MIKIKIFHLSKIKLLADQTGSKEYNICLDRTPRVGGFFGFWMPERLIFAVFDYRLREFPVSVRLGRYTHKSGVKKE